MHKRFRTLRLVSTIYRVIAWIGFILGFLLAVVLVIFSAIQGQAGAPSPLVAGYPIASQLTGLVPGIIAGVAILVGALIQFVAFYAVSEMIQVSLAIEENTRETARFLRGEGTLPPPPPVVWPEPSTPETL